MSQPQYGREMAGDYSSAGSVRKARERAQTGLPREESSARSMEGSEGSPDSPSRRGPGQSRIPIPQGGVGVSISRPTQIPQWPLPPSINAPAPSAGSEPYRPPPGRSQPPKRPPRPSKVHSILDSSRVQDHTPMFQYAPQDEPDSTSNQDLPLTPASRLTQSTISSVGSIPDFPVATGTTSMASQTALAPPRRSANLGPPPSARRRVSSFYSNSSFVSPIPEERSASKIHGSFASSAAMPEYWNLASPELSPGDQDGRYFDDAITEEDSMRPGSQNDDDDDESKLVRSASIGKRGKPAIVMNRGAGGDRPTEPSSRPGPSPMQTTGDPFRAGTGYLDVSSSSSGALPTVTSSDDPMPPTADAMLGAYAATSSSDAADGTTKTPSPPQPTVPRHSTMRRPPKLGLDMDAVRAMEARGSMTSLPDLIRRATHLASMIERGKRPDSRLDNLNDFRDEKGLEKQISTDERHRSGLSDMLAAFPPPAATPATQTRASRGSWFRKQTSSWPFPPGRENTPPQGVSKPNATTSGEPADSETGEKKKRRRCCGLPLWLFIILLILLVLIIAAAIAVPLYFFVFREQDDGNNDMPSERALDQCEDEIACENGGTNAIAGGVCSCICTNGFTGSTCEVESSAGCTSSDLRLMTDDLDINNVTLGQAIPRLIQQAQDNFTVPLVGTTILAKFNQENLSCIAQNSLVTFDGQTARLAASSEEVVIGDRNSGAASANSGNVAGLTTVPTITVPALQTSTMMEGTVTVTTTVTSFPTPTSTETGTSGTTTVIASSASTSSSAAPSATPSATFTVTEEVLDFSRVAMLFILQERNLQTAEASQTNLQRFFSEASGDNQDDDDDGATQEMASDVQLAQGISINLVDFAVDMSGATTGRTSKRWLEVGGNARRLAHLVSRRVHGSRSMIPSRRVH